MEITYNTLARVGANIAKGRGQKAEGFRERQRSTERVSAERSTSKPHAEVRTVEGMHIDLSWFQYLALS